MSEFRTSVGTSDADSITVMGRDVASELMGNVTLTELAFLVVQRRMPSSAETRLLDAVLTSLADHGLTPIALAARLTHTGAPESLQGAVAAGLLGAGSVFLGVVHPVHKVQDPRTPRIYEIADETGFTGRYLRGLRAVAAAHTEQTGRDLPINGAGVAGAALADLGFPIPLLRGFALLARTAGLLGHLAEEMEHPLGMPLYREVEERAVYDAPTGE